MKQLKRILILGGGIMQLPAIRIAKERGWYVVVADGSDKAPGIALADSFLHVDLKDHRRMIDEAARIKAAGGLDGVCTAGTDFSLTVAMVARALCLPGIPVEAARAASDKAVMRRTLAEGGVAVPGFVELAEKSADPAGGLSFPLVVKPADNMGARGVRRVDTCDELEAAIDEAFSFSRGGKVLVEEYIDGPEFSIDAVVENGVVHFCGIADRHITFEPWFVEMGHTIPTVCEEDVLEEVKAEFLKAVKVLGIDNGAAKGDVKYSGRKAWIGEIAARLSGGFMSGWTYPLASGVEPTAAALNIAVGLPAGALEPRRDHTCAERGFISIPGTVSRIEGEEEVRSGSLVRELFVLIKPGDRVVFPRNNVQKCGNVIASGGNRQAAVEAAERGAGAMLVVLEPGDDETGRFLFGPKDGRVPDAFTLALKENIDFLERLPGDRTGIFPLPALALEDAADWHGTPVAQAFDRAAGYAGLKRSGPVPSALFWKAFLRGGFQGAVWLIDTLEAAAAGKMDFSKELERWQRG